MFKVFILRKVLNTWAWKWIQILAGNIILMIFLLNWIEPVLSFLKWENLLVLKYYEPSILLFLTSFYATLRAQIFSTIQRLVIFQKRLLELIFKQGMPRTVSYSNKPPSYDFMLKFFRKYCICQQIVKWFITIRACN